MKRSDMVRLIAKAIEKAEDEFDLTKHPQSSFEFKAEAALDACEKAGMLPPKRNEWCESVSCYRMTETWEPEND